ncbi:MAG: PDZ domain-containing protein [Planctomycetes bacterium]|nr:PDZ domain-containing protein [Planctomycetota bacterium]
MHFPKLLSLACIAVAAMCFATPGAVSAQEDDVDVAVDRIPPVERPNQLPLRDLALRLGMELRATANGSLVVADVHPDSQAAALAIREGDALISVERQPITAETTRVDIIASDNPEKKISLVFMRDGKSIPLTTAFPDRVERVVPGPAPPAAAQVSLFGLTAAQNPRGQLVVTGVEPGSAAALAGAMAGDVLISLGDIGTPTLAHFARAADTLVKAKAPGDELTVNAIRDGSDEVFTLILRERDFEAVAARPAVPTPAPAVAVPAPRSAAVPDGDPDSRIIFCMAIRRLASGSLVVTDVKQGSPADVAGIRAGDAIVSIAGEKADSLDELAQLIARQTEGDTVEFGVARADQLGTLQVKMLPCEYKPSAADAASPAPDGLASEVSELRERVAELENAVRSLSAALEDLKRE